MRSRTPESVMETTLATPLKRRRPMSTSSGTTLVELMTAVSMVAILTMIAVPSYLQYVERARRTDAKTALLRLAANQERFYLQNNSYTTNLAQLGFASNETESGYYVVNVLVANTLGYQAIAVPAPGSSQNRDTDCQQFTIDAQNERLAAPDPDGQCW